MSSIERPSRTSVSESTVWACPSRVVEGAVAVEVELGASGEGGVGSRMSSNNSGSRSNKSWWIVIVGRDPEREV